jgi:hypothetical protein
VSDLITKLANLLSPASLQFDLAAALVALVALLFSIVTFRQQRRISLETLRIQRDNDVIVWLKPDDRRAGRDRVLFARQRSPVPAAAVRLQAR